MNSAATKFTNPIGGIDFDEGTAGSFEFDSSSRQTPAHRNSSTSVPSFDPESADGRAEPHLAATDQGNDKVHGAGRTLWVGNIDRRHSDRDVIKAAFEVIGGHGEHNDVVESIAVRHKPGKKKDWCLVKFFDVEYAQLALLGRERLLAEKDIKLPKISKTWTIKPYNAKMLQSEAAQAAQTVSDRDVIAESMVHLDADELQAFAPAPRTPHPLCEGRVQCQFNARASGPFTALWLVLQSDGELTLSAISELPGFDGQVQKKVLQKASVLWCSVSRPKTPRKQYPDAIRLDTAIAINRQRQKFVLAVEDEDAISSGMTLDVLRDALTSCSYAKLSSTGMQVETEKERRLREAAEDMSATGMVLNPESRFRRKWDVTQVLLLTYVAIVVPFRVAFNITLDLWSFWFFFDVVGDLYFISDMFLSFQTAYYDDRGELETKTDRIFANYFRTWFPVDFIACLPTKLITYISGDGSEATLLNLAVLLKLLRLARLGRLIARYEAEFHEFLNKIQFGKLVLIMGFIGHWLCCLWFAIGSLESDTLNQFGDPERGWVARTWGAENSSLSTATTMDRYLRSFYWATMTMTTVGYGDIAPKTGSETAVAVVGMVIGGFVFALIVGSLSDLSRRSNPGEVLREEKYGLIGAMLNEGAGKNVDPALARKIRAFYYNHYHRRTAMDFLSFITNCPPNLRDELAYQLHWIDGSERGKSEAGLLNKIPFFCGLDSMSSIYICSKMRSILAVPVVREHDGSRSNLIMVEGTRGEEMYVITEVEMEEENTRPIVLEKGGEKLGKLGSGDFFGELAALLPLTMRQYRTRTRTAFATSEVHLGMLTHDDILQLCTERSEIRAKVVRYVNQIVRNLPSTEGDKRDSNSSDFRLPSQGGSAKTATMATRACAPVTYGTHPYLRTIQPTLNNFEARLKVISDKVDLVLAAK